MSRPHHPWRCAFCATPGKRSEEHVLAKWMRGVVGPLPMERTTHATGFELKDDGQAYASIDESVRVSQNSLLHQVTRTICTTCNNGWMSSLETTTKPILSRLFHARKLAGSVLLTPAESAVLARWAVKTSWTSELAGLGNQNQDHAWLPLQMRQRLAEEDTPPASSWVWLAACHDLELCQQMQAHVMFDRTSPPTPGEVPRRLLASCLIVNGIALLVYSFNSRAAFPPPLAAPHGLRLWPKPLPAEFPPPPVSHHDLLLAVSRYTHWLPLHDRPFDQAAIGTARTRSAP